MCKSKRTTPQNSNHTQTHPGTASDWPLFIDSGCKSQETPLEEWVRFLWLTVTVHPCGLGNLLKLLGSVSSLFWWGLCEGCSSVSAKCQQQLRVRLNRGRYFSYKKIQNKPHSSIHFTGIILSKHLTIFRASIMWRTAPLKGITTAVKH